MYNSINDWIKCNGKQRRLTHRGLVTHIRVSKLCHHWFSQWLGAFSAPSHYLNQCWLIINCTLRNKCEWSLKRNKDIFSQANVIETIVVNMAATLFRSQYVKQCHEMVIISFMDVLSHILFRMLLSPYHISNPIRDMLMNESLLTSERHEAKIALPMNWEYCRTTIS